MADDVVTYAFSHGFHLSMSSALLLKSRSRPSSSLTVRGDATEIATDNDAQRALCVVRLVDICGRQRLHNVSLVSFIYTTDVSCPSTKRASNGLPFYDPCLLSLSRQLFVDSSCLLKLCKHVTLFDFGSPPRPLIGHFMQFIDPADEVIG